MPDLSFQPNKILKNYFKIKRLSKTKNAVKLAEEKKAKLEAEEAETRRFIEEIKARQAKNLIY